MAQVPASSRGVPSSGGTFTGDVNVDGALAVSNAQAPAVEIDSAKAAGDFATILRVRNATAVVLELDSAGELGLTSKDATAVPLYISDHNGNVIHRVRDDGGVFTQPPASAASTLALGAAYQNTLGYDVLLTVYLSVTVNTSGVLKLGVGPTNTPTQQTLVTGLTATGLWPVPIYLPASYYALLSVSGTITVAVDGQIAMPV